MKFNRIWINSCFSYSSFFLSCYLSSLSSSASLALSEFSSGLHHSWDKHTVFCSTCHSATPPSTPLPPENEPLLFHIPSSLDCYLWGRASVCLMFNLFIALSDPHHLHPHLLCSPETLTFFTFRPRRTAVWFWAVGTVRKHHAYAIVPTYPWLYRHRQKCAFPKGSCNSLPN